MPVRPLTDGVWWCTVIDGVKSVRWNNPQPIAEHYFTVRGDVLTVVTKVEAYCALGAVERLHEMGLGDAAVSLAAGEFDHASVQVIAERDRRRADEVDAVDAVDDPKS